MVAARRGSPLLLGVKTAKQLTVDFVDVNTSDAPEVASPSAELQVNSMVCNYLLTIEGRPSNPIPQFPWR
jgi:hypothetical protein